MQDRLVAGLVAVLLVGGLVLGILYSTRKNAVALNGKVLKVRSYSPEPARTIAVIDLRLSNPSTQNFVVRNVAVNLEDAGGAVIPAELYSEEEAGRMLTYYPHLGEKYNQTLIVRDRINSGQSVDRMLAVSLPVTDEVLQQRKALRFTVTDMDRVSVDIRETR